MSCEKCMKGGTQLISGNIVIIRFVLIPGSKGSSMYLELYPMKKLGNDPKGSLPLSIGFDYLIK